MVPFAGWHMPIQYPTGVIKEHLAVRNCAGIFDVSHMGEIDISGGDAGLLIQNLITNDISRMTDGSVIYTLMCNENGGVVDDLLVYRFSKNHYFLCVNASNSVKDFKWVAEQAKPFNVQTRNISAETAQLAIQGPLSESILKQLTGSLEDLKYYHFKIGKIDSIECIISRTGYTGEDGFEIYLDSTSVPKVYQKLMEAGQGHQLQPAGLAARDTLRMEMGYPLYGQEIDESVSPLEAGLGWIIKLDEKDFVGKAALEKQKLNGLQHKLIGVKLIGRGVPRPHCAILRNGQKIGELTSGTYSPSLKTGIGLGYVLRQLVKNETTIEVEIRGRKVEAEVVILPFVPSRIKK